MKQYIDLIFHNFKTPFMNEHDQLLVNMWSPFECDIECLIDISE